MEGESPLDKFDFSKGCFYPPTVVTDITSEDELWQEEVFGPVVVVRGFEVSSRILCYVKLNQNLLSRLKTRESS